MIVLVDVGFLFCFNTSKNKIDPPKKNFFACGGPFPFSSVISVSVSIRCHVMSCHVMPRQRRWGNKPTQQRRRRKKLKRESTSKNFSSPAAGLSFSVIRLCHAVAATAAMGKQTNDEEKKVDEMRRELTPQTFPSPAAGPKHFFLFMSVIRLCPLSCHLVAAVAAKGNGRVKGDSQTEESRPLLNNLKQGGFGHSPPPPVIITPCNTLSYHVLSCIA